VSDQTLEEIAAFLLSEAKRHGASEADVVVVEGDSLSVGVRLGEIEKVQRSTARHLGLRAFAGKRSAITSSADFSRESLAHLAEDAVALAGVTAADDVSGLPDADQLASEIPDLDLYDPEISQLDAETATRWCLEAEAAAMDADDRITNSEGGEFGSGTHRVVYAASNGFQAGYRTSSCSLSAVPVATQDGTMERDYWYSAKRRLSEIESPAAIGARAAERALRRLGARQVGTAEVPVVFDPDMAASLVGHLAGAVSGHALYRGVSFLEGELGNKVMPDFVSIVDQGDIPGALGSKPFDGEGLATRRTPVIDRGVLSSYLFDTYSARKLASRSTGNASRSVGDAPGVSPTNLYLAAGDISPEDIIRSVSSGLYVTELMGFGVNPVTGDYSRGASGQWIENGELAYPVSEITIAGNLLEMFATIEAVGSDLEMRRSICSPTLKIAKMTVAGS